MNLPIAAFSIHSSEKAFKVQLLQQATQCGSSTVTMVEKIWFSQLNRTVSYLRHFLSLARRFPPQRLELACQRALFYGMGTPKVVKHILKKGWDRLPLSPYSNIEGKPIFEFDEDEIDV